MNSITFAARNLNIAIMLLKYWVLIFLSLVSVTTLFSQTASLKGNVSDGVTKDGLAGAYVSLSNTAFHKVADDKGNFELLHLPAGEYDLVLTNVGYTLLHRHITLREGQTQRYYRRQRQPSRCRLLN